MKLFPGQVAVVTGAATGIGLALAEAFRSRGLDVVMSDVDVDAVTAVAHRLGAYPVGCDVSDRTSVDQLASAALGKFGRVDVICNNAGVSLGVVNAWELEASDWAWVLGVNLMGVIHGVQAFLPYLHRQGSGHILNTASLAGIGFVPGMAPYTVSKHGVVAFSEVLRAELSQGQTGVGVTVVAPGAVRTDIATAARNRPVDLRPSRQGGVVRPPVTDAADPSALAAESVEAIEADRFYVSIPMGADMLRDQLRRFESDLRR